jgi:hypothetical protein
MKKAILTFEWVCSDFQNETYKNKFWKFKEKRIVENFSNQYVDLEEGWYVDEDKSSCFYYTKWYNNEQELENFIINLKPLNYKLDCFVKYEYSLMEFESENCDVLEYKTLREKMFCVCKENTKENCFDDKTKVKIVKLNSCVNVNKNTSVYIKQQSEPKAMV